jgi:LPPG:FO 2-phospho-L-lactate transferase
VALNKLVVLVGGVGGAKLAYGLSRVLAPEQLTVIVNVADDFWHYGLRICPDLDTIMYTLADWVDPVNGWGIHGDTTEMLTTLRAYGEVAWFRLGDRDLATHLLRTELLRQGERLTTITGRLARAIGIQCTILPVTDQPVSTILETVEYGRLEFQEYFVKHRWQPEVRQISYQGANTAQLSDEVHHALRQADAIVFGPSNPWLSIEPILSVGNLREHLSQLPIPRIAMTPIIEGQAVKGPAAKIMRELGYEVSARAVAEFYGTTINGFIRDQRDTAFTFSLSEGRVSALDTLMHTNEDKIRVAQQVLALLEGGDG